VVPAIEAEIQVSHGDFERYRERARFDVGFPDRGYAWVFPKREHLSIGCLTTARGKPALRGQLEAYLRRLGLTRIEGREDHGYAIPVRPRCGPLARDGVLLTGDAAGLADPVICEGISHALLSGCLAADAITAHFGDRERVQATYHGTLKSEILSELAIARRLARLLYDLPRISRPLLRRFGLPLSEAVTEIILGRQSYRSLLRRPANYLRLLTWSIRTST
jgi:flavin-dependent dehydrogenase